FESARRVVVIHRNVPNMVSTIASSFAGAGLNIEHMTNRSKKNYAVTLVDLNAAVSDEVLDRIGECGDILKVRLISR
ncbi:MAG: 3-phosphoglycerate dehydrogenase, partial [Eubacteriales bacterium]